MVVTKHFSDKNHRVGYTPRVKPLLWGYYTPPTPYLHDAPSPLNLTVLWKHKVQVFFKGTVVYWVCQTFFYLKSINLYYVYLILLLYSQKTVLKILKKI